MINKMKHLGLLFLVICVLCSCQSTKAAKNQMIQITNEVVNQKKDSLTVYYTEDQSYFDEAIAAFEEENDISIQARIFHSEEEMATQLGVELPINMGPDVILFPSNTSLDIYKAAINGYLEPLNEMFQADQGSQSNLYKEELIRAGYVGDYQYYIPLTFQCEGVYIGEEDTIDTDNFLNFSNRLSHLYTLKGEDFQLKFVNQNQFKQMNDLLRYMVNVIGLDFINMEQQHVAVNKELLKAVCNFVMELSPLLVNSGPSPITDYGKKVYIPNVESPYRYNAVVGDFAAIHAGCKEREEAYLLIRHILNYENTTYDQMHLPVNETNFNNFVDSMNCKEDAQQLSIVYRNINNAQIPNKRIGDILEVTMGEYLKGGDDFDSSYSRFIKQLNLYEKER
ncbi:MAG: hypothetical protein ACLRZ7_02350 [Lachnospiraceae bacterium]